MTVHLPNGIIEVSGGRTTFNSGSKISRNRSPFAFRSPGSTSSVVANPGPPFRIRESKPKARQATQRIAPGSTPLSLRTHEEPTVRAMLPLGMATPGRKEGAPEMGNALRCRSRVPRICSPSNRLNRQGRRPLGPLRTLRRLIDPASESSRPNQRTSPTHIFPGGQTARRRPAALPLPARGDLGIQGSPDCGEEG